MLPLTLGEWGVRPRDGVPSAERSAGSQGTDDGIECALDIDDDTSCECAELTRGTGTAGVEGNGPCAAGGEASCSGNLKATAGLAGLLSRDRSWRSSTAPLASLTTTTGMLLSPASLDEEARQPLL